MSGLLTFAILMFLLGVLKAYEHVSKKKRHQEIHQDLLGDRLKRPAYLRRGHRF